MLLVEIAIFVVAFALIGGVSYFFLILSIAIWLPDKARKRWLEMVQSPAIQDAYTLFKWVAPTWVIVVTVVLVVMLIEYLAAFAR